MGEYLMALPIKEKSQFGICKQDDFINLLVVHSESRQRVGLMLPVNISPGVY
jgi:hypothetical protein